MSELIIPGGGGPRIVPPHNLFQDHGPHCPDCSGLGRVLRLGVEGAPTREAAKCRSCRGTGVNREAVYESQIKTLLERLGAIESEMIDLRLQSRSKLDLRSQTDLKGKMSRQYWSELIAWSVADGTAVASSTTETIIFPNVTMPANFMQDGRQVRLKLQGKYSTLGSGTVTLVFKVRWGGVAGTLICGTGTITTLISQTNAFWEIEATLQTRSNGATGTIMGNGTALVFSGTAPTVGSATGAPAVAPLTAGGQTAPAAVSLDLTADTALAVTVTHGANSASNTATGHNYGLEALN